MKGIQLSPRQAEALEIIRDHIRRRGVPPSRTELARAMNIGSQGSVDRHLAALATKGWVQLHPSVERGIQLLREGVPVLDETEVPSVAAGTPIVAEEGGEIPRVPHFDSFSGPFEATPSYFLKVAGESMNLVGFHSGDMLAVRRAAEPREGDLVVARIADEITLKRYHRASEDLVELQPQSDNPEHETIRIGPDSADTEIVGVVVGAIIGTRMNGREMGGRRKSAAGAQRGANDRGWEAVPRERGAERSRGRGRRGEGRQRAEERDRGRG